MVPALLEAKGLWGWQRKCWIMTLLEARSFSCGTMLTVPPRGGTRRAALAPRNVSLWGR